MARLARPNKQAQRGGATIEFVAIFLSFIAVFMFVVEFTLYIFAAQSVQKAAQAGVRAAVVSDPVVASVPLTNNKKSNAVFGVSCSDASDPCAAWAGNPLTCTGSACVATEFDRILAHMQRFYPQIAPQNVTVSYENVGLGYAGGPSIPYVAVTVEGVPYRTMIFSLLMSNLGVVSTLPPQRVGMTGEDLSRGAP